MDEARFVPPPMGEPSPPAAPAPPALWRTLPVWVWNAAVSIVVLLAVASRQPIGPLLTGLGLLPPAPRVPPTPSPPPDGG